MCCIDKCMLYPFIVSCEQNLILLFNFQHQMANKFTERNLLYTGLHVDEESYNSIYFLILEVING